MEPKIGLQLYAVRDLAQEDLPGTLEKVLGLGFGAVEFPDFFGERPGSEGPPGPPGNDGNRGLRDVGGAGG